MVSWNSGSWVLGVQAATTMRFKFCSFITSTILSWVSWLQVKGFPPHRPHGQALGIFGDGRYIGNPADIDAAVAYKNTDAGFLTGDIIFLGKGLSP